MATYKLVNADKLDSDLAAIGDAIRSKGGTVEALSFPAEMVSAISAISTGVELNFEVVPNPQPSVATENTIWVDTDRINNYYFSAEQPENMVDYDVWFPVGTSSAVEFNALKKGGIQVYPLSAKQMVSGALVDKAAKSYQNGEWKNWITVLWDASKNYENLKVLGDKGFYIIGNNPGYYGSITKNASGLVLNSGSVNNVVKVSHDNIIDFTNLSELVVEWSGGTAYEDYQGIGIYSKNNPSATYDSVYAYWHKDNTISETVPINLEGIDQKGYIVIFAYNVDLIIPQIVLK